MVDPPSPVVRIRIPEVIPIGILHAIRVQLSKHIDKAPRYSLLVGVAGVDMKIGIVDAAVRMVHIDWFRRYIQVAKPHGWPFWVQMSLEVLPDAAIPLELERI